MSESKVEVICKEIKFSSDEFTLKGTLHLPSIDRPPVVIGCHGLFSTGESPKQIALAKKCAENGIAYFRFDHRGCGQSEGIFAEVTSLDARCRDLKDAVRILQSMEELGGVRGFFGSSFGGTVCISTAPTLKVDALVTFAAPIRSSSLIESLNHIEKSNPDAPSLDIKNLQFDISDALPNIHHILIFQGDSDKIVPPSQSWEIYNKALTPKRLIMQKDGDHYMSRVDNQERFVREAMLWFKAAFDGEIKV